MRVPTGASRFTMSELPEYRHRPVTLVRGGAPGHSPLAVDDVGGARRDRPRSMPTQVTHWWPLRRQRYKRARPGFLRGMPTVVQRERPHSSAWFSFFPARSGAATSSSVDTGAAYASGPPVTWAR